MKIKNLIKEYFVLISMLLLPIFIFAQHRKSQVITDKVELAKLKAAVEASPDSLSTHKAYTEALGTENPELEKQYARWMNKFPKSAMVPYGLAKIYLSEENPKAKPYLLKAVEIDPKFTEAWAGLWQDGERWGDFIQSRAYLQKAAESDPNNPNYAFYYASSFSGVDQGKWIEMSLDVAKRFPKHERGAQALYWLAERSTKTADKIKYYDLLHDSYPPSRFGWSASGMSSYYNLLLKENPKKAIALAQEMAKNENDEDRTWRDRLPESKRIADAKELMSQNKGDEALAILNSLKLQKYSRFGTDLAILKAEASDLAGRTNAAYDSLIVTFAKAPSVALKTAIGAYAEKLGKNLAQADSDIRNYLKANRPMATPFNGLKRYLTEEKASLSDFKGKVVLLTYWFPGCGPCRGEFPHFENVVKKFETDDLAYIGINIVSKQNSYVVPFMKASGYSFTPLEEIDDRDKGNLDNQGFAPMNFLIDREGRLMFANFRTDANNEEDLELMIKFLCEQ